MNELASTNKALRKLIRTNAGLEGGFQIMLEDLRKLYRFSDVGKFNLDRAWECYWLYEEWLNSLVVFQPFYDDIVSVYFGMFDTDQGIGIYVIGSKTWKPDNPDWASRHDWYVEDKILWLPMYKDISMALSKLSYVGYYLAVAQLCAMIQEYTASSVISLLDDKRRSLHIACGFDDGELYDVGELFDSGLVAPAPKGLFG